MAVGFAAALAGDWLLAIRGAHRASSEFAAGVLCFSLAQIFWTAGQLRESKPRMEVFAAAALPLALFAGARLHGELPPITWCAVLVYSLLSAFSFAVAVATRRRFYVAGVSMLLVSDLMIGGRLLGVPGCSPLSGPLYAVAEMCLLASFILGDREPCRRPPEGGSMAAARALASSIRFGVSAGACFALAALSWPGGGYNPFMRMLSALGRTVVHGVEWPWCHYFFMAGMFFAIFAVVPVFMQDVRKASGWRRAAASWGLAANAAGLASIALVPENVDQLFHNVGCWSATLGGGAILFARLRPGRDRAWALLLGSIAAVFGAAVGLHAAGILPHAPWTPTLQKMVIAAFSVWTLDCAARAARAAGAKHPITPRTWALVAFLSILVAFRAALSLPRPPPKSGACYRPPADVSPTASPLPFSDDERTALEWLGYVTGPLPPDEEREWWDVGGSQHGLFAKRYHIAFCGYAAAALGWRGGDAERAAAGRILGNCVERMLRRDVWAYSQSKSYWGRRPWAPDPCHRENVMFTGHLLQLLALYETFTGDGRYWTDGWDFVWKDGAKVHYDVRKLIEATVRQMRQGPNGGVTCEPGLMFFPCNNHPHVALALFKALGHGDWTADARRWERWALARYWRPIFGGGALNLVYHARSGIMFPRGNGGLDGWSLLWYEPWAEDRATALAIWREAAARIDWAALENGADEVGEFDACRNPADVPPVAAAAFLAAAARACDDPDTASRLEAVCNRHIVRREGRIWLDCNREWRVGATSVRMLSLAEQNGLRLRDHIGGGLRRNGGPRQP